MGDKVVPNGNYEFQFPMKKEKLPWNYIFYNPKDGTILGRTGKSWFQIIFFYLVFYAVLAGLFAICMQALFKTLDDNRPKWTLNSSLIGANPGVDFRPRAEQIQQGSIIKYTATKDSDIKVWTNLLEDFFEPYRSNETKGKFCDFNTTLGKNDFCRVDLQELYPCVRDTNYGYNQSKPCIFLKLNKIIDWEPSYYDDITDLPEEMPTELKDHIKNVPLAERKQIWISCKGRHAHDEQHIGNMVYIPRRGFPAYYYPYTNVKGYLSPLIAVQFLRPSISQPITIECRAWAKNIIYSSALRDRKGSVLFELIVDA